MESIKDTLLKVLSDTTAPKERRELAEKILAWIVREVPRLRDRLAEGLKSEAEDLTEFRADSLYRFPQTFSIGSDDRFVVGHIAHTVAKPALRPQVEPDPEPEVNLAKEFQ